MFFLGGLVAAGVTHEVRKHVEAALRDAQHVQRLRADLELARSIQQALLPGRSPDVPGCAVAGWTQPAEQTGGDYYDWLELPDGRLTIALADVSGHGISAALVTANCHSYFRASVPWHEDLRAAMDHLNRLLASDLPDGRFVTFAAATLDANEHRVKLLSAGHGPLLLYKAKDHTTTEYRAQGIPLGVMPDAEYADPHDIRMEPGDVLVLVTDGVTEWANDEGEQYGLERLRAAIANHAARPPGELIERIHKDVIEFAGNTPQLDDLTMVAVTRLPPGA
jgi:phosphoserine phosphatase